MQKHKAAIVVIALLAATVSSALAETARDVEKRLKKQYPATNITAVRESKVKGIYEVIMGRNVAYTDKSGRYMIFGHLFDMVEQRDLTAEVLDNLNRVDASMLPKADAIKTVRGKGERALFVFSDPDCPYCKRLEEELANVDNVTVYTFLYPLEALHPDARRKAVAIWCAKDKTKAWEEFMLKGTLPEIQECENPIDRNLRLGKALGINGTPTLIFSDGVIVPGVIPSVEINRRLSGGGKLIGAAVLRKQGE